MMHNPKYTSFALALGGFLFCAALLLPQVARAQGFGDTNPYASLRVSPSTAGEGASHTVALNLAGGELEAQLLQISYPDEFRFEGFTDAGGENAVIGHLFLSNLPDGGRFLQLIALRAIDADTAYADVNRDEGFTEGTDIVIRALTVANVVTISIPLPFGGDFDPQTVVLPLDLRVEVEFEQGVFVNPREEGDYRVSALLISVDPDTDSGDDGEGDGPRTVRASVSVTIGETGLCSTGPAARCRRSAGSVFVAKKSKKEGKDLMKWVWTKGDATSFAALGTPESSTAYALCVYDSEGALAATSQRVAIAADGSKWTTKAPKLAKYKDKAGTADGTTKVLVKAGASGKAKIVFLAKGANLVLPEAASEDQLFALEPNLQVQLIHDGGECWGSEFTTAKKHTATQIVAK